MSKSLGNLTLAQLIELKNCADMVSAYYAECLTDYATIASDATLKNMTPDVAEKYLRRRKSQKLSMQILNEIEQIISEYYDD